MSIGSELFDALYEGNTDQRGTIETKNGDVIICSCAGFTNTVFNTGQGIGTILEGSIHTKAELKTETGFDKGDQLKHTDAFGIITQVRIQGISNKSGFITIFCENPI